MGEQAGAKKGRFAAQHEVDLRAMQHQRVPGFYDRILAAIATARIARHIAEEVWPRANGVGLAAER